MKIKLKDITIVFYHANCHDGMSAAAIFDHYYPGIELIPMKHFETPNQEYSDQKILFLDFSFPEEIMLPIIQKNSVYVVDHHETANYLKEFLPEDQYIIQNGKCGALLLWEFINAKVPPPIILQYVNDRDLWLNQLPDYQYVFEGIVYLKPNVEIMEDLIFNTDDLTDIIKTGKIVHEAKSSYINFIQHKVFVKKFIFEKKKYKVGYINCPLFASDVGNFIVENFDVDFAAVFHYNGRKTIFSLRGKDKIDLSKVAEKFNGGGHYNASGCAVNNLVSELI